MLSIASRSDDESLRSMPGKVPPAPNVGSVTGVVSSDVCLCAIADLSASEITSVSVRPVSAAKRLAS